MTNVTMLGMGAMGSRMARNLIDSGHPVTVWNRTREKTVPLVGAGATTADTPADAVRDAEIVIAMVRDDEASREVWLDEGTGALEAMPTDAIAIDSSTLSVSWARELARACDEHGVPFLDAPVLGSRPQAEAAELIHFVGGDAAVLERARSVLERLGSAIHHVGGHGTGAALKLMVNAMLTMQVAAVGELLGLLRALGVDQDRAVEAFTSTPVCSPAAKGASSKMLARDHDPLFPVELVEKDLSYVAATARDTGSSTPLSDAARRVFAEALKEGLGEKNMTAVATMYE